MTKYLSPILLVVFTFIGVGCQGISQQEKNKEHVISLSFIKENGMLKVKEGEKICLLADDAIDYETFVSPDATLIAVETLLMSDLQIVRMYKKDTEDCFLPLKHPLSVKLWHDLSIQKGFSLNDINHPRMKFLKWINKGKVLVELTAENKNKTIDTNISCDIQALF